MTDAPERIRDRVQKPMTYLRTVINLDEDTKHDRLDRLITQIFPYFVVACVIICAALILYLDNYSFTGMLFGICLGFALGFTVLGLACVFLSDRGVISGKYVVPVVLVIPALAGVILYLMGADTELNRFIIDYFNVFGSNTELASLLISIYSISLMIFFVAYGVVSVIVGYFRTYFYRVLRALEYPAEKRRSRIPGWLFQIPDIIDIQSVEFEPDTDDGRFNTKLFRDTAFSLFVLGIVICSYFFINPLFLQIVPFSDMILIGMLLSLFISPLVIPWSIVRSIGAKITSAAPRDFYLWKGMRGRLYQGFFTITFFMMLLTLSLYLGMDFSRIAQTYLGYVAFMALISIITSFVYVNTYYKGFKNGIIKSYILSKNPPDLVPSSEGEDDAFHADR
ncbi:MAG: hypothetical protein LBH88_01920 [Candidatus Methanoplasma sp.]|jgi:hypothetical protein|nr:hypothetical protein [Candidatus Methanoplasma sp.]